ncbi:MAG: DUF309 domain-containing protein [Planctomycetota bacterium]
MGELTPVWPDAPRRVPGLRLPPYRFLPGVHARPGHDHVQMADPFDSGVDLYHLGYLWEAHEAWEAVFREVDGAERHFIQGLVQIAAAGIKRHLGNERGVDKLVAKSCAHLEQARPRCYGVDVSDLIAQLEAWHRDGGRAPRIEAK